MVFLKIFLCFAIGYLLGCISPSYIISKAKKIDLRRCGTKNLGTTNAIMSLGKAWGAVVMLVDIVKAWIAVKLCQIMFPSLVLGGIVAGSASVLGHNHPFYLRFKGGKGVAAFGGFVLAFSWQIFLMMLAVCLAIAFVANYSCMLSFSAAIIFPFVAVYKLWHDGADVLMLVAAFIIIAMPMISVAVRHSENLRRIKSGEENKFTVFISKYVLNSKSE